MELIPKKLEKKLPPLYSQEDKMDEALAVVKLFTPDSSWTWYVTEYDPEEGICFGLVDGHCEELGYFSIHELENVTGPLGLKIERDLYWQPKPLKECRRRSEPILPNKTP
jgi:hypothetical protein